MTVYPAILPAEMPEEFKVRKLFRWTLDDEETVLNKRLLAELYMRAALKYPHAELFPTLSEDNTIYAMGDVINSIKEHSGLRNEALNQPAQNIFAALLHNDTRGYPLRRRALDVYHVHAMYDSQHQEFVGHVLNMPFDKCDFDDKESVALHLAAFSYVHDSLNCIDKQSMTYNAYHDDVNKKSDIFFDQLASTLAGKPPTEEAAYWDCLAENVKLAGASEIYAAQLNQAIIGTNEALRNKAATIAGKDLYWGKLLPDYSPALVLSAINAVTCKDNDQLKKTGYVLEKWVKANKDNPAVLTAFKEGVVDIAEQQRPNTQLRNDHEEFAKAILQLTLAKAAYDAVEAFAPAASPTSSPTSP